MLYYEGWEVLFDILQLIYKETMFELLVSIITHKELQHSKWLISKMKIPVYSLYTHKRIYGYFYKIFYSTSSYLIVVILWNLLLIWDMCFFCSLFYLFFMHFIFSINSIKLIFFRLVSDRFAQNWYGMWLVLC